MDSPTTPRKLAGRYEVREVLGKGGMGLVYRAYDSVIRREVAVKTLLDIPESAALQLFYKECDVLASMSHPNIVEIFDIGEFEEEGKKKPYFVMPLLPGTTLETFIRESSHRLTVERTVQIMAQACRGLQAAHERGLIHRDLKPSNIFVMEDDSVKIIDFGVAHMADTHSTMGQKGTLLYMSPEQIEMKPLSAASDIFSLSVVCYEALTGRQPFQRARADEIVDAILRQIPPPASEINPAVSQSISRAIHKGMAKQAWHRYSSAREFGDTLNKALRNEPIEFFDASRTRPRLQRATKALEEGDYQFASEILGELEAEGHLDDDIGSLRQQLNLAVRRKTIAQLLDAAKARFDEEEDPLALQKLQEVLQMEPDNAMALSLKSRIESRRSERQIENWYKLARQHIDNHAYPHAREALQNVLQLRPQETNAVKLIGEVDRQEQEYNKLRQEKSQIHRAAMDAWQKGDVSSALTKLGVVLELDRRAPDLSNPERGATYQSFYNEVRSEHDAMNNAYAEARKNLADHNFSKALGICEAYLAKYPTNAIFQALKYDVEEQQRQELSAYIASVDRQVEAEPDLDKRVNILREALDHHPGESHFERALRLVQDKRDLVNSIVARAHHHEEQAAFGDALNDWEILRTIYSQYPGLKFEIERLQKRREQQTRIESKTKLVEQIDACMHSSDYTRALDLAEKGKAEFPDDAELSELEKLANEGVARKTEAQKLMTEGQDLCAQAQAPEGLKLLRQAYELDENNTLTRAVLSNALIEQAHHVVDNNWQEAEQLAHEALDLNPGHPMAKTIRSLVLDQKREQVVKESLAQARKLQATDLQGALTRMEEGLAAYPREPRLIQVYDSLQRDLLTQKRQTRRRDLEELRRVEREVEAVADEAAKKALGERAQALASKYTEDPEFLSVANPLLTKLNMATVKLSGAAAEAPPSADKREAPGSGAVPVDATMTVIAPVTVALDATMVDGVISGSAAPSAGLSAPASGLSTSPPYSPSSASQVTGTMPPPPVTPKQPTVTSVHAAPRPGPRPPEPPQNVPGPVKRGGGRMIAGLAAGLVILLVIVGIVVKGRHSQSVPAATAAQFQVQIHTTPPGATIRINNEVRGTSDLQVALPEGSYQIEAQLNGYMTATTSFEAKAGSPNSVDLTLQSALPIVRVSSDTGTGKISFDDQSATDLEGAQWSLDKITPGEHKVKFEGPQGSASFTFTSDAGSPMVLTGPVAAKGVLAVVISNLGGNVNVYSSNAAFKVSLDGQAEVAANENGVSFPQVSPGPHELALTRGSEQYKLSFDAGQASTLSAFLESGKDIGTLVVVAGQDKAKVLVNGQLQRGTTQGGQLRIPDLEPKDYMVRISKPGFQDLPEQKVRIRKGEQTRVVFNLQPIPKFAALSIQGASPGTEVLIDQTPAGTVQPDGTLDVANIAPGDHVVELRRDRFKPRRMQKHFVVGTTVAVSASEAVLEAVTGTLKVTFSPVDATVTIAKGSESPVKVASNSTLNLAAGTYTLNARSGENLTRTATVDVVAGETRSIDLQLTPGGMSKWDDPSGWKSEKGWYVHRGGDFVLYSAQPASGTFGFTAMLLKGKRFQWVINYVDAKNYCLYQMDENFFYRSVIHDGQKTDEIKIPHKTEKKAPRTIQIRITPGEIVHQVREEDAWFTIDKWSQPGTNLSQGKFGLYIPGGDQVALSNFTQYADLSAH
jgi:serine/threonine protein kinase